MSDYKVVPAEPTPEMVESAESAYMLFGDMELALMMAVLAAPAVQGEPVAFRYRALEIDRWSYIDWRGPDSYEMNSCEFQYLSATPQPAEQQPAPDVEELVEALVEALTELCDEIDKHEIHSAISETSISWFKRKAREALAAHYKQGGEV